MIRGVAWREHSYATVDRATLSVRKYRPVTTAADDLGLWPTLLHVDGGAWNAPSPEFDPTFHKVVSRRGVVCLVPETRCLPEHHPASMLDAERAVRWTLDHADSLGVDRHCLVLMGSGSGAHSLLGAYHSSVTLQRLAQPRAVVAVWPAVDPLTARRRAGGGDGLDNDMAYFGSLGRMRRAGLPETILDGANLRLPLLVLTRSRSVPCAPPEVSDELAFSWRRAGGAARVLEVEPHELDPEFLVEELLATDAPISTLPPSSPTPSPPV
ncbi:MAG: alpha/beta hydrolase [Actinomycetota bacterium]|nr:alpha/beta hydrolase [Actinomycetota bacterium]